jgi:TrmH family RNA methyltransferase
VRALDFPLESVILPLQVAMSRFLISSKNAEYQIIEALKLNRLKRNKLHEIFVEGIECIKQAIRANVEITRIITRDIDSLSGWGKDLIKKYGGVKIVEMPDELYNNLSDKTNPSELLITAKVKRNRLEDLNTEDPFIVVFDRPGDHGNLGSIIRSANAFKVDGILIMGHGIDVYETKVIRASMGSVFFTKVVTLDSMETLEGYIKTQRIKNNMEIIGTDSTGAVSIGDRKITRPVMVVIGNEAKGISVKLKGLCNKIIRIPTEGEVNSLNVSNAASIIMWEIYKNKK